MAVAYPLLAACEKKGTVATHANTSIRGISLDGVELELEKTAIKELGDAMTGPVMLSGHPDYDGARKIWNGMHDKRPAQPGRFPCRNLCSRARPACRCSRRWPQLARQIRLRRRPDDRPVADARR
jgi:hypothetical protein